MQPYQALIFSLGRSFQICEHMTVDLYYFKTLCIIQIQCSICICLFTIHAAAAAKLLQSCPTLCGPVDGSPPGSPVPGILQARALEWVAISFSNVLGLIRKPKYWSFSISPSNEYSGLISFRVDWFDLLAVQGNLKSPLQHHSLKASILWHSSLFMVQLSHLYMTGTYYTIYC